jgi:toxin-antitoxin system PIN domain toxin
MRDLLDVSVWLPLSAPDHVHYKRARRYWDDEAGTELVFCRLTALALLRYLTNTQILGKRVLNGASAWKALSTWLSVPHIHLADEPQELDAWLGRFAQEFNIRAGDWTDAYLAAFAAAGDYRLVTFDADFRSYKDIKLLHLRDETTSYF